MNIDDYIDEMERFEYEGATKLSPIDYARSRDMRPQLVYYYIRNNVIEVEECVCGRRVVDVEAADEALRTRRSGKGGQG